jgi:hypothetical protein
MTVNRRSTPWALLVGLAAMLLLTITGCAGQRAPSDQMATERMTAGDAVSAPAPLSPKTPPSPQQDRDIVTTGSLDLTVSDVGGSADKLIELATSLGGRVDDRTQSTGPGHTRTATLTVRIPSAKVDEFLDGAQRLGEASSLTVRHDDVTSQRVDLDARVKALQASVDRLTTLMKAAATTADLLEAEKELTSRQADLDSLRAQRAQLGEQTSYATLTVSLASEFEAPSAGFVASVRHGWHALLSFTHGLISITGFLLPWLPVIAVLAGLLVVARRRSRRRRQ